MSLIKSIRVVAVLSFASALLAHGDDKVSMTGNVTNRFVISGMHCDGCARGIAAEVKAVPGVLSASVDFTNKLAVVVYEANRVSVPVLLRTVKEAGYEAKPADKQ